ncbi:uncharacterized protein LOC135831227 [Planococcus citri]|uniref:uncharacterized protein LOC135831227 n=1 Tax=Planococcus citri TaxID=170843 RepID=UPI0031F7387A
MEMKRFNNNSHQSSLSDQTPWKSKLRALIQPEIHFRVTPDGKHHSSWDIETLDMIRKRISQDMAEGLQKESNKLTTPIMKAARYGNYSTIEQLLTVQFTPINPVGGKSILHLVLEGIISLKYEDDPVKICMENIIAGKDICDSIIDTYFPPDDFTMFPEETPDHYKCLDLILQNISPEKLDINFCDSAGNSALHYAAAWSETAAIKALLQAGAYSCTPNKNGMIPLKIISPQVLEEYLDSCVLTNDYPLGHDDFQIYFNYQLFLPPEKQTRGGKDVIEDGCKEMKCENGRESEPLFVLNERPDLRKFLTHPVIRNYFCLKWLVVKKYSYFENILFIWFFLLFALFLFINSIHIYTPSLKCPLNDDDALDISHKYYNCCDAFISNIDVERKFNINIFPMNLTFAKALIILRGLLLVFIVHRHYFSPKSFMLKSIRMWLQMIWVIIILLFVSLHGSKYYYPYLAIMIIALSIEFVFVLGRSPEYSMGIQMVKVFVINVCKYLSEFFVVILFLAISFVVFFNTGFSSIIKTKNTTFVNETCPNAYHTWMTPDSYNNDTPKFLKSDRSFALYILETFITMLRGDPQVKTFMPFDNIPFSHALFLAYCFLAVYTINNLMIVVPMTYANQVVNEAKSVVMVSFLKFVWYVETAAAQDPTQLLDLLNKLSLWSSFCFHWCLRRNPIPPESFRDRINVTHAMTNSRKEPFYIHNEKTLNYLSYGSEIFDNAVNILKRTKQHDEMEKKLSESESRLENMENVLQDTQLSVLENQRAVQENQRIVQENQRTMQENEEKLRRDLLNSYNEVIARLESLQTSMGIDYSSSAKKLHRRDTQ